MLTERALRPAAFAALLVLAGCREPVRGERELASSTPAPSTRHPARVTLVPAGEPGDALEVGGQVFAPDGVTPASGVTVYVYQTDVTGRYATGAGEPPRLRGWMTTDAEGRYSFRTIRPAPYPSNTIPAHVHVQLWGGGWPWQYSEDVQFADDPFLDERARAYSHGRGRFGGIHPLERSADGVLRCTHDVRLKPEADRSEDNILHGVRDEPGND